MKITDIKPQKTRKKTWIILVFAFLLCFGIGVVFIGFPDVLNRKKLINIQFMDDGKVQRVITLYSSITNSEDGSYLRGYWLYVCDPLTGKELNKIFIKRTDKNNDIPATPNMYAIEDEIWIVGDKGIYQGDVGFLSIINVKNDLLELVPTDFMKGFTISSSYMYDNNLTVTNQYNESGCLNMKLHQVDEQCAQQPVDSSFKTSTAFFFLKNTASSTRSHLYYYSSSKPLPQPGIFAGFTQQGTVTPGWHLIDHINMQRGFVMKEDMNAYIAQFDSSEKVFPIYDKEFLNNPNIIYSDQNICVLTASADGNSGTCSFYQFSSKGNLNWKVECPKLREQTYAAGFLCSYHPGYTIIRHPQNWVLSINNADGKINWQYPR